MKESTALRLLTAVAVFLCALSSVCFVIICNQATSPRGSEAVVGTEWVYVYVEHTESEEMTESEEEGWFLRVWGEGIGVFREDGTLVHTVTTNIKTLPKADRDLLEEGIYVRGKDALDSLLEDYSE